jgi:hypothetical protein
MKNYKDVEEIRKEIISIECDKCHRVESNIVELQEWFCYNFVGGFNSIFGDMNEFEIDLCQECFKELLGLYIRNTTKSSVGRYFIANDIPGIIQITDNE